VELDRHMRIRPEHERRGPYVLASSSTSREQLLAATIAGLLRRRGQERSRTQIAARDDSLGEAAPFNGLGGAQPLESASVEIEIGGER